MSLSLMSDFAQSPVWKLDSSSTGAFPAAAVALEAAVPAFTAAVLEVFLPMVMAEKGAVCEEVGGFEIEKLCGRALERG